MQLEKHINVKFPEYQAKFYSNRQNLYIHMGLDQSLFSFENFRKPLQEIDCFLNEHWKINLLLFTHQSLLIQQSGNTVV